MTNQTKSSWGRIRLHRSTIEVLGGGSAIGVAAGYISGLLIFPVMIIGIAVIPIAIIYEACEIFMDYYRPTPLDNKKVLV